MNLHWRSRDAYKAAFMNIYAFTELQRLIADTIAEKREEEVLVGKYTDISDSYHIYGNDFEDFKKRFLRSLKSRNFYDEIVSKSRTIRSDHYLVQSGFQKGKRSLDLEKRSIR
jgi:thymidylate synthase